MSIDWDRPIECDAGEAVYLGSDMDGYHNVRIGPPDIVDYFVLSCGTPTNDNLPESFTVRNKLSVYDKAIEVTKNRNLNSYEVVGVLRAEGLLKEDK